MILAAVRDPRFRKAHTPYPRFAHIDPGGRKKDEYLGQNEFGAPS